MVSGNEACCFEGVVVVGAGGRDGGNCFDRLEGVVEPLPWSSLSLSFPVAIDEGGGGGRVGVCLTVLLSRSDFEQKA